MKTLSIYIFIISLFILPIGCSKDFLENPPLTTITDVTFPINERDALLVTNAAYNNLRNWWYLGGYPLADIMSDDQTKGSEDGSNPDLQQFENFTFNASHAYILAWYQTLYQSIRQANIVIEKVPPIVMDEQLKSRYIAEAKFLRAYSYFTLVRLFDGVPIITTTNPERTVPRSSAQEVYSLILSDLEAASSVLPEKSEYLPQDLGRATKGAAKGLLVRVYLTLGDYSNTLKYAEEIIASGQYQLMSDFSKIFTLAGEHGSESLFEIASVPGGRGDGGNQYNNTQGVRGTPNWGWGFGRPSWDWITSFEENDPRLEASVIFLGEIVGGVLIEGNSLTTDTTRENGKIVEIECYNQKVHPGGPVENRDIWGNNRRIIRYADILLMAAEAYNELGDPTQAGKYLNQVRNRARNGNPDILPDVITTDKIELRNAIWDERRHELAFEQIRYFDLKRQGRMAEVLGPLGFTAGKNELLPIPQQEIDLSEGRMQQNPNW